MEKVVVGKFVDGLQLACLVFLLVLEYEVQDAESVYLVELVVPTLFLSVLLCHLAYGERGVVYAPVLEKLLEHVLHLHDILRAALGGAVHVEYGLALGGGTSEFLGVEVGDVENLVLGYRAAFLKHSVEEAYQKVFVEFRAEEFLESEVGVWVDVLCHGILAR